MRLYGPLRRGHAGGKDRRFFYANWFANPYNYIYICAMQDEIIDILKAHYRATNRRDVTVRYVCNMLFDDYHKIVLPGERFMAITRRELHRMKKAGLVEQVTPVLWRLSKSAEQ